MKNRSLRLFGCLATATLLVGALALSGCSASEANEDAERSFTDEQLESYDGSSYFPDTFTFDELLEDHDLPLGHEQDDAFEKGAYVVGTADAPAAGTYHVAGTDDETGDLTVYAPAEEAGTYRLSYGISYLGFTLIDLKEGDAVFFDPPTEHDVMRTFDPAQATGSYQAPFGSGLYRAGTDIPAGTYTVTQSDQAAPALAAKGFAQPQAIVYSSLDFSADNKVIEETLPPLEEGPLTVQVTVEDGQYLELYGCTANPEEA